MSTSTSRFQTTSWTLVAAAAQHATPGSRVALASLCHIYWRPVYAFIRRNEPQPHVAQDLTQTFFTILLEKNYVGDAKQDRGRFRSFLLTAVKHFLANQRDHARALKRGGGQAEISIDATEAESWYLPRAVDNATPEHLFEVRWALSLLEQVMAKLRAEFVEAGASAHFDKISVFLQGRPGDSSYEAVAKETGVSAGALRTQVSRLRRRYRDLLRAEIAQTVSTPQEIDDEIKFLISTLSLK